jgi:alkanesulfonate monooxygenase SsuD/methylene tetrahydromethanopterin reductase-like flavin-dependent oxidoreductase (luciferase family)
MCVTLEVPAVKFGVHELLSCADGQSPARRYRESVEEAVFAEAVGFESVWPVEQHFHPQVSLLSCPTLMLAAIAERTHRLRLGTAIVQHSLDHPLRVAEEIATLDVLSGGRVELGVGRGSNPSHFQGFGAAQTRSRERFAEALAFIGQAFAPGPLSFSGRFYQAEGITLVPRPLQQPHPPIHIAANSPETAAFAGQIGCPVIVASHINPMPWLRGLLDCYRVARAAAGHAPAAPSDITILMPLFVGPSRDQVRQQFEPSIAQFAAGAAAALAPALARCPSETERERLAAVVRRLGRMRFDEVNDGLGIFDTPAGCRDRLAELTRELQPGRIICWFNLGGLVPHKQVLSSMLLFAMEVMPAFA